MNKVMQTIKIRLSGKTKQDRLVEFVSDQKNLHKAVEGSMDRRLELLGRVDSKQKQAIR